MAYPLSCGVLNGVDDVLIAGAAAEIAGNAFADLALGGRRVVVEQVDAGHDHAGRAESALQAVLLPEALLQRVQFAVRGQPLDGRHLAAVGLHRKHRAGLRAAAVDEHGARAALARVAADVRAGQVQLFAQEVHEQRARFDLAFLRLPFTVIATSIMGSPLSGAIAYTFSKRGVVSKLTQGRVFKPDG